MRIMRILAVFGLGLMLTGCAATHEGGMSDDPYGGTMASPTWRPGMYPQDIRDPNALTQPLQPARVMPQSGMSPGFSPAHSP